MRFSALVVIGDGKGKYGFATAKANEVPDAIKKATASAKIIKTPLVVNIYLLSSKYFLRLNKSNLAINLRNCFSCSISCSFGTGFVYSFEVILILHKILVPCLNGS